MAQCVLRKIIVASLNEAGRMQQMPLVIGQMRTMRAVDRDRLLDRALEDRHQGIDRESSITWACGLQAMA